MFGLQLPSFKLLEAKWDLFGIKATIIFCFWGEIFFGIFPKRSKLPRIVLEQLDCKKIFKKFKMKIKRIYDQEK
ncbi:hypothetical protein BC751_1572 [Cecembia calidifontis]|jgi:hypothetical protein|uniref:Uncharacterized protein n=1 Tax=Cecembia calidifontis TaxID=1187080 RepID=A0A4Q7P8X8_9BACT|nr:hypothetical protein BC751_1572 [Cecembia calidifontis]